jgi:predicted ester cyclase
MLEENKTIVRRLVEGINGGDIEATVDELFAPRAAWLFTSFHSAFPDWREEIVELVAEENTVAGRFRCSGTHQGEFLGEAPTGKRMEVDVLTLPGTPTGAPQLALAHSSTLILHRVS